MIILSGSSGGIGEAILPQLSKLGPVLALYNKNPPKNNGIDVTGYQINLSETESVANFIETFKSKLNEIVVVHAASLSIDGLAAQLPSSSWAEVMNINLNANFELTKGLLSLMISQKWGRIIHISSLAAMNGEVGTIAYSTAKSALFGMSKVLSREYARFGVTSNVLVPGYFNVGLINSLTDSKREQILNNLPSRRLGDPINIFNAIEFLIRSDYVNGSVINIDGGA